MTINILSQKEKNHIIELLSEQFGIKEINGMISMRGSERLFLFQGDLKESQIKQLETNVIIERIGVYFARIFKDKKGKEQIRLSIEGSQILQNQITENIFELDEEQTKQWMMGQELNIKSGKNTFLVMKYEQDFLGTGKASEEKISNFIPKNRRLKK